MAEAGTTANTEEIPPRFWWLKRIAAAMVMLAGLLVGLRYWALSKAQRQFAQEIESIRQSGDPVYAQDFASPPAATGEGATKLLEAARHFRIPRQSLAAWDALPRSAYSTAEMAMIDPVLLSNRQHLKLVREARSQPLGSPGYDVTWGTANGMPMFNEFNQLADALSKAGHRSHQNGDDAEAVEYLRDQLSVERILEHYSFLTAHLIAQWIAERVSQDATSSALRLKIKFDAQGEAGASEAQVRGLIADLLNEPRGPRCGWRWARVGERFMNVNAMGIIQREVEDAPVYVRVAAWWTRPIFLRDETNILRATSAEVKAAEAEDFPTALEMLTPTSPAGGSHLLWKVRVIRGQMMKATFMEHYQSVRQRRQAAIALAERMHELKHGKRAQRVEELMPEFLSSAPLDPVAGGSKTLGLALPMQAPAVREQNAR